MIHATPSLALPPGVKPDPFKLRVDLTDSVLKGGSRLVLPMRGVASADVLDKDGETVDQSGLDFETMALRSGRLIDGHPYSREKEVGELVSVEMAIIDGVYCTILNALLWLWKERGLRIYREHQADLARGLKGYGLSIEGHALERAGKRILRALVTHVAIDRRPRNPMTWVEPFGGNAIDVDKVEKGASVALVASHIQREFPHLDKSRAMAFAQSWINRNSRR